MNLILAVVLTIFQQRQVSVAVPDGWQYAEARDERTGVQTATINDPSGESNSRSVLPRCWRNGLMSLSESSSANSLK